MAVLLLKEGLERGELISPVLCLPWRRGTYSPLRIIPFGRKRSPKAMWKSPFVGIDLRLALTMG